MKSKAISAESLALQNENEATPSELTRRQELVNRLQEIRSKLSGSKGAFPAAEQMQREDRSR